jgi:hypothetical protein
MFARVSLSLAVVLAACAGGAPPAQPAAPTAAPAAPTAGAPRSALADAEVLHSAEPGVYATACETECADELAELVTYRDAAGRIAIVTVMGTPQRCTNPPLLFFGPDGTQRAAIPMKPVVRGSEEAKQFDAIRERRLHGLTKAETMYCREVKH